MHTDHLYNQIKVSNCIQEQKRKCRLPVPFDTSQDMEVNRSRLLATARPYLQVLALLGVTPPPVFFTRTLHRRRRGLFIAIYGCFLVSISLVVIYECYANIVALQEEVHQFHAEDFSRVMGWTQKFLVVAMATCNHLNILLNFRRLGRIYEGIANLELDADNAAKDFRARRYWWSFRFRMALYIGGWMVLIMSLVPRLTVRRLAFFLHWANATQMHRVLCVRSPDL